MRRSSPDESLRNLPETAQAGDFSKYEDEDNISTPEADKREPSGPFETSFKEQQPATVLSNVHKDSPIDLADENKTGETITFITQKPPLEARSKISAPGVASLDDISEEFRHDIGVPEVKERDAPVQVQHAARILPSVDKGPPIDLPGENDSDEASKTKDSTEPNDEMATD